MALLHYPVINKSGEVITSAVTNLDLHDIARVSKTYGVPVFYVITPLLDQQELVKKIISHWTIGHGSIYNPKRREALELISVKDSIEEAICDIQSRNQGIIPKIIVSCAKDSGRQNLTYRNFKEMIKDENPYFLLFGTAWGISQDFILKADYILEPIKGTREYNHLSVRSAAGIILDRLMGNY
ncbi:MAG: RNA methyltransferase [Desulfobacterales bacterium]|nr:RNA methyltransferase [Desulfobacterales bacterium]